MVLWCMQVGACSGDVLSCRLTQELDRNICSRILWDNCMHGACVGVGIIRCTGMIVNHS